MAIAIKSAYITTALHTIVKPLLFLFTGDEKRPCRNAHAQIGT